MKFCVPHWEALRVAIKQRGLKVLMSETGEEAVTKMARSLEEGPSIDNYDPLMSAHWAIAGNAMEHAKRVGGNPLCILSPPPEHPEWGCPICFLNFLSDEHDRICGDPACSKPKGMRFDDWIDKAADGQVEAWKAMR